MMQQRQGLTILELLVAAAVLIVMLALLGQLFIGSRTAYQVIEDRSEERQILQTAVELLKYEVGLAGYRCTDSDAGDRVFATDPLTVDKGAAGASDTVIVTYYEDRFVSGASCDGPRTVTFSISNDAELVREVSGGDSEPEVVARGVEHLEVTHWLNKAGSQFVDPTRPPNSTLSGIKIGLTFESGDAQTVTIGMKNPQCRDLADCL